ncbi:MAG: VOC family protein [Gammaproteobacteria bacterium]|nr:VOC family protein [Gammaproteobacteria bacterium]
MANYTFHHVHHEASDVDKAVEFYQRNFDGVLQERNGKGGVQRAKMIVGGAMINITDRADTRVGLSRYQGLDHFAFRTDDFEATMARLRENGVNIWQEPESPVPGVRVVFISGPDDVKIEVLQIDAV